MPTICDLNASVVLHCQMDKLTARQAEKAPRLAEELNSIHSFEATHYLSAAKGQGLASLREDLLSRWGLQRLDPDKSLSCTEMHTSGYQTYNDVSHKETPNTQPSA